MKRIILVLGAVLFAVLGCSIPEPDSNAVQPTAFVAPTPDLPIGQRNALGAAESYISLSGFSRQGLLDQLSFEGYSAEDATFAVDNVGADWNAEAAESAQSYIDLSAFSRQSLLDQLIFSGFTPEEAEFGVTAVGY